MKITHRKILHGLGAMLAGLLAPKCEAQEVQTTGAGRLSVLIPENWGRSTAGDNPEFEDGNDEWMPENWGTLCGYPVVLADDFGVGIEGDIVLEPVKIRLRQTKEKMKEKVSCRIFTAASDDMHLVETVYLDDEDVTDRCAAFYGTMEPGEVDGWADLFTITRQSGIGSSIAADENGYPVAVRHSGVVRWERFA